MTAEQKSGVKPLQVSTLMRVLWGERCTEQKTSKATEAVGVEKGSVWVLPTQRKIHVH